MNQEDATAAGTLHPIGVVAERTGLSLDVLRVWERRYGVVEPTRDEGGRRLYSDGDIERLRLLAQAISGGRAIRQVAHLPVARLRELVREDEAARWHAPRPPRRPAPAPADEFISEALARTRELDGPGLEALLRRAASLLGLTAFLDEVVPGLARRIGDEWHAGRLSVAQEHLALGVLRPLLAELRGSLPAPSGAPGLLVATPAGEQHELGALLVAAAAAAEGWRVTFLGPDVPADDVARAALDSGARAVALSVVYVTDPERTAGELARLRARLPHGMSILLGGAGLSRLEETLSETQVLPVPTLGELRSFLRRAAGGLS